MKRLFIYTSILLLGSSIYAQENSENIKNEIYVGPGFGLDYGGIGAKIEYKPIDQVSLFGGLGYNLVNLGWNVGATYNIKISKKVTLGPTAMYGYNAALRVEGAPHLDKVSNGPSFGVSGNVKFNDKGKLNFGLYFPIRSKEFTDHYDMVKNSPYIDMQNSLIPITFSVGYNFKIK